MPDTVLSPSLPCLMDTTLDVVEQSQVAPVRRLAVEIGRTHGFSELDLGRVALVATEMCTNLVKYGSKGSVTVGPFYDEGAVGVQLIAVDEGPGFADFHVAARDGHSTGGSLGIGLGAIMRAADLFDTYTVAAQGSAFLTRVSRDHAVPRRAPARVWLGARRAAMRGEVECGDAWEHASCGRWERLCVVDGLGHGPMAAVAAAAAVTAFRQASEGETPDAIVHRCHAAMTATRGAVMAVAAIDPEAGRLLFAGVGNIAGVVHGAEGNHSLLSTEGIVGHRMRRVRLQERRWSPGDALVMSSDGLRGRWNLDRYPGLMHRHPLLVASVLFRDFGRDADDATVLVAKDLRCSTPS